MHEFTLDDKVSPERSIYMPDSTVVPCIDISHLANDIPNDHKDGQYTFEIHKRGTQVLQRDRVYVFRTNSREELLSWCRALVDASTRTTPPRVPIMPQHTNITPTNGMNSGHSHHISRPPSTHGSSSSSQTSSITQQNKEHLTESKTSKRSSQVADASEEDEGEGNSDQGRIGRSIKVNETMMRFRSSSSKKSTDDEDIPSNGRVAKHIGR